MKMRPSVLIGTLFAFGLLSTTANADIKTGQKAYLKECRNCHGNGTKGAAMKTQHEWSEAFKDDAKLFREWHKDDKRAMQIINSDKFESYVPHLRDFLYHYGSDSGNVPTCG